MLFKGRLFTMLAAVIISMMAFLPTIAYGKSQHQDNKSYEKRHIIFGQKDINKHSHGFKIKKSGIYVAKSNLLFKPNTKPIRLQQTT